MFKFVKKEHHKRGDHHGQIVITYSFSEIIMGFLLLSMVVFYIYSYLSYNLNKSIAGQTSQYTQETNKVLPR